MNCESEVIGSPGVTIAVEEVGSRSPDISMSESAEEASSFSMCKGAGAEGGSMVMGIMGGGEPQSGVLSVLENCRGVQDGVELEVYY